MKNKILVVILMFGAIVVEVIAITVDDLKTENGLLWVALTLLWVSTVVRNNIKL